MKKSTLLPLLLLCTLVLAAAVPARADRIWWDGSRDSENAPPGKLLSDNDGYWGERVLTGVTYSYPTPPDAPADIWKDDHSRFGRRLLDGLPMGNWWVPVGLVNHPLAVVFDFKRACLFREVDVATQTNQIGIKIECAGSEQGPWQLAFEQPFAQSSDKPFHRLPLPGLSVSQGRFLRLTVDKPGGINYLNEVLVWGDARAGDASAEAIQPISPTPNMTGTAFASVPGIPKTAFSDSQFWDWRRQIGTAAKKKVVWSQVSTWDSITDRSLLPSPKQIARIVGLTLARNETECAALALTSTSMQAPTTGEVTLSTFQRIGPATAKSGPAPQITGQLRIMGAIGSRNYGINLGPLFSADNLLGKSLMRRYLTNGDEIQDFPRLSLPPAGSAVLWLSVTTQNAAPGLYQARLSCAGSSVLVRAEVVNVTLPHPRVWVQTWSDTTAQFPFVYGDRLDREVTYKQSLGVTVWSGLPTPGSAAELAHRRGRTIHQSFGLPWDLVDKGYNNKITPDALTPKDEQAVTDYIHSLVKQAKDLGLSYDDWYAELWDETGRNAPLYGAFTKLIRRADPHVRLYCNPIFWNGSGVDDDKTVFALLGPWYRQNVDISVPNSLLLFDHPQSLPLFDAPREFRAFYMVATQSAKSESGALIEQYRRQAWDAFARGWNGWGFYSYFAPRGDPWNDFDESQSENSPDYEMVYPGPRGPIPTRQSESVREGWQDYCLLSLLKTRGQTAQLAALLQAYRSGTPMDTLRLRALRLTAANGNKQKRVGLLLQKLAPAD